MWGWIARVDQWPVPEGTGAGRLNSPAGGFYPVQEKYGGFCLCLSRASEAVGQAVMRSEKVCEEFGATGGNMEADRGSLRTKFAAHVA